MFETWVKFFAVEKVLDYGGGKFYIARARVNFTLVVTVFQATRSFDSMSLNVFLYRNFVRRKSWIAVGIWKIFGNTSIQGVCLYLKFTTVFFQKEPAILSKYSIKILKIHTVAFIDIFTKTVYVVDWFTLCFTPVWPKITKASITPDMTEIEKTLRSFTTT